MLPQPINYGNICISAYFRATMGVGLGNNLEGRAELACGMRSCNPTLQEP